MVQLKILLKRQDLVTTEWSKWALQSIGTLQFQTVMEFALNMEKLPIITTSHNFDIYIYINK